jgi:hypothetical protein
MELLPPTQIFSTTLYDRYQPKQVSFIFIPKHSLKDQNIPELDAIQKVIEPYANVSYIPPTVLPAALSSMIANPREPNPFREIVPRVPGQLSVDPNSYGFAEFVAYSEVVPFEESPLRAKSLMAVAVAAGSKIGSIAGGATPFVLVTVPTGIILCMVAVEFGPALGDKLRRLLG